jgi:prephenate dehydratase
MAKKVSIQGYEGSFHQIAAQQFLGRDVEVIPCATFREVVQVASGAQSDGGFMAIENSIAGSILPNYSLLQRSHLKIGGEIYLQIHQNLLANPGVKLEDIREVHSHPMALLQCTDYWSSARSGSLWKPKTRRLVQSTCTSTGTSMPPLLPAPLPPNFFNCPYLPRLSNRIKIILRAFYFCKRKAARQAMKMQIKLR